jgi:hypothetical protein
MKPDEPLAFGDMVKRRKFRTSSIMVIEPKVKRGDAGGGWFRGLLVYEGMTIYKNQIGEIALYQRQGCEKVES